MIYAYIRVSTEKQTVENQRYEIEQFCKQQKMMVDQWVEETESGTVEVEKRKLQLIISKCEKGDTIISTEISRFGRSLFMIINCLSSLLKRGINVLTTKERFILDDSLNSKVLMFGFSLAAEVERNLISQRTKEALRLRKAQGVKLGRQYGSTNKKYKLDKHKDYIINRLKEGKTVYYIAKHIHAKLSTTNDYVSRLKKLGLV